MSKTKKISSQNLGNITLDAEEQMIEDLLPDDFSLLPVTKNLEEEVALAHQASDNYLKKNAKINIRLPEYDLTGLRRIAAREGLPYQTLIASVLHKFVASRLGG